MKQLLLAVLIILVMISGVDAVQIADIDFSNLKDRISGDTLTFVQDSIAYERDGTSQSAGVFRKDVLAVASPVEYTVTNKESIACTADYIYAIYHNTSTLYRSKDGTSWSQVYTFSAVPAAGWVTANGTLLISLNSRGATVGGKIYRYANDVMTEVADDTVLTGGAAATVWSWSECNDTIFVGEYRASMTTDNARCIHMSRDDGATWTKIHNPDNVAGRHLHQIVATSENDITSVYACYGDSTSKAMFKITDNNTSTWSSTQVVQPYVAIQPTGGIWLPEQSKVLFGQDAGGPALLTFEPSGVFTPVYVLDIPLNSSINKTVNIWAVKKIGDIYLAALSVQDGQNNYYTGVVASVDGSKWVRIIGLVDTWLTITGLGPDGKVWGKTSTGGFNFNLPSVNLLAGALVERAASQTMAATLPTRSSGAVPAGTTAAAETGAGLNWDGSSCKWSSNATITSAKFLRWTSNILPTELVAGDVVTASFWLKGHIGDGAGNNKGYGDFSRIKLQAYTHNKDTIGISIDRNYLYVVPNDGVWQRVVVPITVATGIANGQAEVSLYMYVDVDTGKNADFVLYLDGVTVEKAICPSEYNALATARAADVLSYTPGAFPSEFTDLFSVASRFGSYQMGAPSSGDGVSYIYIRSYEEDANNFFAIVYDVTDFKFKLINEDAGSNTVLASSAVCYLTPDEVINIGVTRSGTTANVYIWQGGIFQTITGTISDRTIVKSYWGSHPAGTQGGSLVFMRDTMYNEVLSDVKTAMVWPVPLVDAGPDRTININEANEVNLVGIVSDVGSPDPPHNIHVRWSKVSGPGMVNFVDDADVNTVAKFSSPGRYVIRLTANDGSVGSSDDATVTVYQTIDADFDHNGSVDLIDFAILGNQWQQTPGIPSADIAPPYGIVDENDLCIFAGEWLTGTN